jgi:8-oxo-dGTP pyrophosphatase MutT (NUDIX family)
MAERKRPAWQVLGRETAYRDKIYRIEKERVRIPRTGGERDYFYHAGVDWVNVLAQDRAGRFILIKQYRHAVREVLYEIPAGLVDPQDSDPAAAAARELLEETGYRGEAPQLLGSFFPNPAIQSNRLHSFLIRGAQRVAEPRLEEMEEIETALVSLEEMLALFAGGQVPHALTYPPLLQYLLRERLVRDPG